MASRPPTLSPRWRCPAALLLAVLVAVAGCEPPAEREAEAPEAASTEAREGPERGGADALRVAVTIDDLPWVGPLPPGASRLDATDRLLAALARHGVPATGFVNCGREPAGAPVLRRWLEAGMALGNHTEQHLDLNVADVDAWVADVRSCDAALRELTGADSVLFRYPYLRRGPTPERYRAGRRALEELRSPIAPVTINTADWLLDDHYVAALRAGDRARAAEIGDALVAHVLRATAHYRDVARDRVGEDVAHILLLHANAVVADRLDTLLTQLREEGVRFVPLEEALEDPVYRLPDDYLGAEGISWLHRFRPATPQAHAWDLREAARLRARFP